MNRDPTLTDCAYILHEMRKALGVGATHRMLLEHARDHRRTVRLPRQERDAERKEK